MGKVQLSGSEKRALVLWVLAGIIGMWYAQRHFFDAFPEASVNFKVSRNEALARARNFVESQGNSTAGYRSVIVFGVDDNAKTYLEREVGLKEANRLMASDVNVWHWEARFFKPEQEEEFSVTVNPEGTVTGYVHKVPEAQTGAQRTREAAQQTAQNFLTAKMGKAAADWDFLSEEANSAKKPNRLDWSFTWEKHGFKAKDAPERLTIGLHGAEIGSASEALKVPEQWERDYRHLRSTNEFYNTVAVIPYFLLFGWVFWYGIQLARRGQTSWRLALQLGVLVAILLTAMQLNRWPLEVIGYDTNSAYGSFVIRQLLGALLFGIGSALTVTLVLPGGEPLYRQAKPHFLRLKKALTWRGLRTREFFSSVVVGLSFAAAHMGFLVAFYLVANHFGAWAPQEINYEDSVSTAIPWIGGIAIGLLAATSEEFLFRLFAIPFVQRATGSRILAVILPAFSWGFLHTAYPNEPPYIRGLEVGLIGIAAGIIMLRWGILATLVWHYTIDASLVGLLLIRSSSLYFRVSGVVIGLAVLIPFGYAVYSRVRRGTFEDDEDLLNAARDADDVVAAEVASAEPESARDIVHAPVPALSKGMLGFLAVCVVIGGLAALKLKPVHLGDYLKLSVNAREATARAVEILRQRGVDPSRYHSVTTLVDVTDATASEYLRQKIGVQSLNDIYAGPVPGALWDTRFFQDGQAEEYSVVLKPDGALHSVHHELAEAAKGASLTKDDAVAKAAAYLQANKKIDLSQWTLVDSSSEKRPNRVDHTLIWQAKQPLDATAASQDADPATHAFARLQVAIAGDEVAGFRTFIKIPDDWQRQQEARSLGRTLHAVFTLCLPLALGIAALVFFLREIKSPLMRLVPWRRFTLWGLFALAAYVAVVILGDRLQGALMNQYKTAMPLKFMYGGLAIGFGIGAFFYLGLLVILLAMAWFFLKQAYGDFQAPGWRGMPREYYRDALFIGVGGTAALIALSRGTEWLFSHWHTPHRAFSAGFGTDFDALLPGVSISAEAVLHGLIFLALIAVISGFILAHVKSPALRIVLFFAGSMAMAGGWGNPTDFMKQWLAQAIFLGVVFI
ncbi:MAG TPA: type II CAAX endopeptidase family protein, partial [Candidatus Acidoferrum sp.]|nr:type II CAAX endopeptidase family protein [Candidatus Acidoferrum sp.]